MVEPPDCGEWELDVTCRYWEETVVVTFGNGTSGRFPCRTRWSEDYRGNIA